MLSNCFDYTNMGIEMCTWRTLNTEMQRRSEAKRSAATGIRVTAAATNETIGAESRSQLDQVSE